MRSSVCDGRHPTRGYREANGPSASRRVLRTVAARSGRPRPARRAAAGPPNDPTPPGVVQRAGIADDPSPPRPTSTGPASAPPASKVRSQVTRATHRAHRPGPRLPPRGGRRRAVRRWPRYDRAPHRARGRSHRRRSSTIAGPGHRFTASAGSSTSRPASSSWARPPGRPADGLPERRELAVSRRPRPGPASRPAARGRSTVVCLGHLCGRRRGSGSSGPRRTPLGRQRHGPARATQRSANGTSGRCSTGASQAISLLPGSSASAAVAMDAVDGAPA